MIGSLPSCEDLVALSQTWTKRVQLNLEKRQKLHGELASAWPGGNFIVSKLEDNCTRDSLALLGECHHCSRYS